MPRKKGIIVVSICILLFPFIIKILLNLPEKIYFNEHYSFSSKWNLKDLWGWAIYALLGFGLFKLNNIARWLIVMYMSALALVSPIAMLIMNIIIDKQVIAKLTDKYGFFQIQILPWLGCILISVFCGGIAIYLLHPRIRDEFKR
jgi:hypothetical protein